MPTNIGLDLGTHQTKICVQTGDDIRTMQYEFMTFSDENGGIRYALPSVIMINKDDTLSYGFRCQDTSLAKRISAPLKMERPIKPELKEAKLNLPPKPKPKPYPKQQAKQTLAKGTWANRMDILNKFLYAGMENKPSGNEKSYKEQCAEIDKQNEQQEELWKKACKSIEREYLEAQAHNNRLLNEYQQQMQEWEEAQSGTRPLIYRYFKQATFAELPWTDNIPARYFTVWYLAYILFDLEEKYGKDFSLNMGVPTGVKRLDRLRMDATSYLLAAYNLVEEVFEGDKELFLSTKINELYDVTEFSAYSENKKTEYGIGIYPEAFCSLKALTSQGKLSTGMNLLVDIGGGTTDISFFSTTRNERYGIVPEIYNYDSVSKGLNYIAQCILKEGFSHFVTTNLNLDQYNGDPKIKKMAIEDYNASTNQSCINLCTSIYHEFFEANPSQSKSNINNMLSDRPIVFTGGGSTYSILREKKYYFSDVQIMKSEHWQGLYIKDMNEINKRGLCPILSVSLGLAQCDDESIVKLKSISNMFEQIARQDVSREKHFGGTAEMLDD